MALLPPLRPGLPARLAGLVVALALCLAPTPARAAGAPTDPVGVWPLDPVPEVVATFDPPSSTWGSGHRGVDLLGSVGQPVLSALPGHVTFAGRIAGRGVVVVDHGDTRTTYEPVTATLAVGDEVAAGHRVGVLELAGSHCFPRACLHWGWLRGETYLDPLLLVGAGPVRLLPLWRDEPVGLAPPWMPPVLPYDAWRPVVEAPVGCCLDRGHRVSTRRSRLPSSVARLARPPMAYPLTRLCPRMRLLVGPAQPVGGDVCVELGRGE